VGSVPVSAIGQFLSERCVTLRIVYV